MTTSHSAMIWQETKVNEYLGKWRVSVTYTYLNDNGDFGQGMCHSFIENPTNTFDSFVAAKTRLFREYPRMRFVNTGGANNQYHHFQQLEPPIQIRGDQKKTPR